MWFETHKHSEYSLFDGFGKVKDIVKNAVDLGYPAMGITDHGNTCSMAKLYLECKKVGIKPILGVEAYFQPKFDKDKEYYHMCLFAKNQIGYSNIMQMVTKANQNNFYKRGYIDFKLLEEHREGVICTSACIAGFIPRAVERGNKELTLKAIKKFIKIFDKDFYFEIMPIPIDGEGTQKKVNRILFNLGKKYKIKCIPTTDSHYTRKDDFDTYQLMHKMAGSKLDIEAVYGERHMHSKKEIVKKLRKDGFGDSEIKFMFSSLKHLYNSVDIELDFSASMPSYPDSKNPKMMVKELCLKELKETGRYKKEYLDRCKEEFEVLTMQNLHDYFLIVWDYVKYAKDNDIYVGPGRGSICNCLIADLLNITDVDPVEIGNDFGRFLRSDKKKMPDIDLDFEQGLRDQVIDYVMEKYKGRAAQVITYGFFKVKNLCNDLGKHFELSEGEIAIMKRTLNRMLDDHGHFDMDGVDANHLLGNQDLNYLNKKYPGIMLHFSKLYGQIRYFGMHAAGVVITNDDISKYISLVKNKGKMVTCFDKYDIEALGLLKFDILGLKTLNEIHEVEELTKDRYNTKTVSKERKRVIYEEFKKGNTTGIFQLNKNAAKNILSGIHTEDIQDLIAAISLNRPGPLQLKMHEKYLENKLSPDKTTKWYKYTSDSYGSIVYQEHVMRICRGLADMNNDDIDMLMKFKYDEEQREELKEKFIKGSRKKSKMTKEEATFLFDSMTQYLFNKGHASGYAIISEWQMYHKIFHPTEFWYSSMKYANDESKKWQFRKEAVKSGVVLFLPHTNYTADYSIREMDGEKIIQEGLTQIKGVGLKAAQYIEQERKENGNFTSKKEFIERCRSQAVNKGVISVLDEQGAMEYNHKRYTSRVIKYNSSLYAST